MWTIGEQEYVNGSCLNLLPARHRKTTGIANPVLLNNKFPQINITNSLCLQTNLVNQ